MLDDVIGGLHRYIKCKFEVDEEDPDFTDDVHLFEYGYVDSFGAVDVLSFIHDQFSVEITDEDLVIHPLNTIREIATLVHQRLEEKRCRD